MELRFSYICASSEQAYGLELFIEKNEIEEIIERLIEDRDIVIA